MFRALILAVVALQIYVLDALSMIDTKSVRFRPGTKKDELRIKLTLLRNFMNPLGIDSKRFIIAVDPLNDENLYGWAQLRPIGFRNFYSTRFDSKLGSGSLEQDIEEDIWEEFDQEDIEFPNGFASFPWSKEYNQFANQSSKRRERREYLIEKAKLDEWYDKNQIWELASVYVQPNWRNKGIGSELIRRILGKHKSHKRSLNDVYLLTVGSRKKFYEDLGFCLTDNVPVPMEMEMDFGRVLSNILRNDLIAMKGTKE